MKKAKTIAAGIAIAAIIFLVVYIIMPLALTFAAGLNRRYNQDKMRRRPDRIFPARLCHCPWNTPVFLRPLP